MKVLLRRKVQSFFLVLFLFILIEIHKNLDSISFIKEIRPTASDLILKVKGHQLELNRIKYKNEQFFENEMFAFKNAINQAYLKTEIKYEFCKRIPDTLKGYLNSTVILNNANLSNLVKFYDKYKYKNGVIVRDLDILNSTTTKRYIYKKNDSSMPEVNWLLWNSNNMSGLLNMSQSFFGEDGNRVELGK